MTTDSGRVWRISPTMRSVDSSSFFALQAAAVAIAADTPHTDMSAEITMLSEGDSIRSTRWPNQKPRKVRGKAEAAPGDTTTGDAGEADGAERGL